MLNICILSNNVIKPFMNHKLTKPILSAIGLSERPTEMSAFFPLGLLVFISCFDDENLPCLSRILPDSHER